MERSRGAVTAQGLGLCSISYDSVDILREFAARRHITFPMLSDAGSAIIRRFGLFRDDVPADSRDYGIPHPGTFLVDAAGIVKERFFEEGHVIRMTTPAVLSRLGVAVAAAPVSAGREHLRVRSSATDTSVYPGNRFTLFVDVDPLSGVHIYGPAAGGGYQGLDVAIEPLPYLTVHPPRYPAAAPLALAWTDEALAGYTSAVRVAIDVVLGTRQELAAVLEAGQGVTLEGTVRLQACDDRVCWAPEALPVRWHFDLRPPDLDRSPEPLQHKAKA